MSDAALCVAVLLCLGTASQARAFTEPSTYFASPQVGGGGGRWFTGSPAEGYACSVCHEPAGSERVRLSGLPEDGYEPGKSYQVSLAWPEFAARAQELREQGADPPSMSLVTELVAESGEGAGTIQIAAVGEAEDDELCAFPAGALSTQMFRLPPGMDPVMAGTRCTSDALGERCVLSVLSCGAGALRFTWTAPEQPQGTVWFAAGFVATERVSGDPNGDSVTELLVPLAGPSAEGGDQASVLQSGCRVAAPGSAAGGHAAGLTCLFSWFVLRRRRGGKR